MSVKKIFIILITIVACVILGALVLNVLMPNVVTQVVNAVEQSIYSGTGISMDLNGDGVRGSAGAGFEMDATATDQNTMDQVTQGTGVEGFQ